MHKCVAPRADPHTTKQGNGLQEGNIEIAIHSVYPHLEGLFERGAITAIQEHKVSGKHVRDVKTQFKMLMETKGWIDV